ncbi:MAG: hypothetical protein KIT16_04455 [Rhodospirillaceae bacterium]|nr:hypothetical protein [Rhodospirillaceae bacterium]
MGPCSRRVVLGGLAAATIAFPAGAESLGPVVRESDEAGRFPALEKVRAALRAAVKAKSFERLRPHVDAKILIVFGGENGIDAFARMMRDDPTRWDELDWVLAHGGRFLDGEFWAPYVFQAEIGPIDPGEAGIVVAPDVAARSAPRADAPVVARLSHHAVRIVNWGDGEKAARPFYRRRDWLGIELPDKRRAWVEARQVRIMGDFRAGFALRGGAWKMTAFVSGD